MTPMPLSRKQPSRVVFPRKTVRKDDPTAPDLSSCLTYALLILYILASVSSTKDVMLLVPSKGIQLPLVSVTVSVVGFYTLSPLLVLIGHLVTLRRLPKMFAGLKADRASTPHEALNHHTDRFMLACLLCAGPATLLFILTKFTAYQSPYLFAIQVASLSWACSAALVRARELLTAGSSKLALTIVGWGRRAGVTVLIAWLAICVEVIYVPSHLSPLLWIKAHTKLLNNTDGGTVSWIPHIEIDREERLWAGPATTNVQLATLAGHPDLKDYFMAREVGMDLRSRNLRYLDVSQQILPRIWAHQADLAGANFAITRLYGSVFEGTILDGARFDLASLDGATFMNVNLNSMTFVQTSLKGTFWDNVTVENSLFYGADLSLASFFGVTLNHVDFEKTSFQATTFFATTGNILSFSAPAPFKILRADDSGEWLEPGVTGFEIDPKAALASLQSQLCTPKLNPGWAYAWNMFIQLRSMLSEREPEVFAALQELLANKACKELQDRGALEHDPAMSLMVGLSNRLPKAAASPNHATDDVPPPAQPEPKPKPRVGGLIGKPATPPPEKREKTPEDSQEKPATDSQNSDAG